MEQKGKLVEDFEDCEQAPQISILQMEGESRSSINPEWAKSICESFGCKLNDELIRTSLGHRENVADPSIPRVAVSTLAKDICEQLGLTPDEKLIGTANRQYGEGSRHSLTTQACCKVLREKFGMEAEY